MKTVNGKSTASLAATTGEVVNLRAKILLTILTIGFLLQIFTPLRLNTDAVTLLSMADSAAHGSGFLDDGEKSVFPPGYPAVVAVLLRSGLAHPWVIVSLNMIFLSLGLYAAFCLLNTEFFSDRTVVILICCLFLLSYVVVKHSTMPLTEGPFFMCSMGCLLFMSKAADQASHRHFVVLAGAALLSAVAAIAIRRIGVAFVPPLAFAFLRSRQFQSWWKSLSSRSRSVVLIVSGVVAVGVVGAFAFTSSWRIFISDAKARYRIVPLWLLPWYRLKEFGELLVNFPTNRMPAALQGVVPWMGVPLLVLLVTGLAARRRQVSATDVFIVCYAIILFAWPYYDARFWWPVIPLLIAYSQLAVQRCKIPTAVVTAYCLWFAILGFGTLAYSTRISFSGCQFPDTYGSGDLAPTYRAAFEWCHEDADPEKINARVLRLLREYR
jgi:hypothetical protein